MSFLDLSSSGKLGDQTQCPPILLPTLIFGSLSVLPLLGISVCHTVREGEDKTATNKPNRRIPGIAGGSGSSARLICNIKIDSTPSGLGGPAFEALPSESPSEASKYDA